MSKRPASPSNSNEKVRTREPLLPSEMEKIVWLREKKMKTKDIARLLDRSVPTINSFFKRLKEANEAETTVAPETVMEMLMMSVGASFSTVPAAASDDVPGKQAVCPQQQLSDQVFNQPRTKRAAEAAPESEPQQQSRKQLKRKLQEVKRLLNVIDKTISSAENLLEQL